MNRIMPDTGRQDLLLDLNTLNREMGRRVRLRREMLRLTVEDLSQRIGLSPTTLTAYEAGSTSIPAAMIVNLKKALSVDLNYFWGDHRAATVPFQPGSSLRLVKA